MCAREAGTRLYCTCSTTVVKAVQSFLFLARHTVYPFLLFARIVPLAQYSSPWLRHPRSQARGHGEAFSLVLVEFYHPALDSTNGPSVRLTSNYALLTLESARRCCKKRKRRTTGVSTLLMHRPPLSTTHTTRTSIIGTIGDKFV